MTIHLCGRHKEGPAMSSVTETSHTSYQGSTHTHYLPSPRCAASVKAEALKCKRFMKFIYVPVKMPTATESRRERGGRWAKAKGKCIWGRLTSHSHQLAAAAITIFRCCGVVVSGFATKLIQVDHAPPPACPLSLPFRPAGPWLGAVGWAQLTEGWASPWRLLQLVSNDSERRAPSWLNPVKI